MTEDESGRFHLERDSSGLQLQKSGERGGVGLSERDLQRRLRQGKRLLLARACAAGPGVSVLDATAGFGLDGLTLSALGCSVTLCERHPMVYELLEDAAHRLGSGALARGEIELMEADAREVLRAPIAMTLFTSIQCSRSGARRRCRTSEPATLPTCLAGKTNC